jgi:hypothetical protein
MAVTPSEDGVFATSLDQVGDLTFNEQLRRELE